MNRLEAFEYDGQYFDVDFDDNGNVEKIMMYLDGMGFLVDLMDVTALMTDWFKEKAEEKFREQGLDEDRSYESWKDSKSEESA